MFIGRDAELAFLQNKYDEKKGQLLVLYGRRHVGKTETLREFCKGTMPYSLGPVLTKRFRLKQKPTAVFNFLICPKSSIISKYNISKTHDAAKMLNRGSVIFA